MSNGLVLSLFPGIGLLDMAFEDEGFSVVRGPDPLWGGDIRRFHVPPGRFDGIIGGPPCPLFSRMRHLNPKCGEKDGNLIPEFERVVAESDVLWFVMEEVPDAPLACVPGYEVTGILLRDLWVGGTTERLRRFSLGSRGGLRFHVETSPLHPQKGEPAVLAQASVRRAVRLGGSGKVKYELRRGGREKDARGFASACAAQGLPEGFDIPPFTVAAKLKAIGNGVPLPMGKAVARAVRNALVQVAA